MAADQLESCGQSDKACGKPEALLGDSGRWFAAHFLVPSSGSGAAPPVLTEMTEADASEQREPCPGVEPESYLETMPELELRRPS